MGGEGREGGILKKMDGEFYSLSFSSNLQLV